MADDRHYVPGDFYRICDRTGFKIRAGRTRKEWTGNIVRDDSWEARHPQDFVQGVRDDQTVPQPRPRQLDRFTGPLQTTLIADAPFGAQVLSLGFTARMFIGDVVELVLDNGETFRTAIFDIMSANNIQIKPMLPYKAQHGNLFTNLSAMNTVTSP